MKLTCKILISMGSIILILLGLLRCYSEPLADFILANSIAGDEREFPPTAYPIPQSAYDVRLIGGRGEGLSCSVPSIMEKIAFSREEDAAPISLQNRQACAFHDYCYRHGHATYGYTQNDCDQLLQEHAFKLCKFTSHFKTETQRKCQTRARLVTLGVIFAGASSFRIEDSTYFEFDPHPYRSKSYMVYRIADTPNCWIEAGALPKSTYIFDVQPTGMKIDIEIFPKDIEAVENCPHIIYIPGRYESVLTVPVVSRTMQEDWFVWWQKDSVNDRNGEFRLISPGRSTLKEWNKLNLRSENIKNENSNDKVKPAFVTISKSLWNTSEFHTRPWVSNRTDQIKLTGVTTHACREKKYLGPICKDNGGLNNKTDRKPDNKNYYLFSSNVLCYRDQKIDVSKPSVEGSELEKEPLALRGGARKEREFKCADGSSELISVERLNEWDIDIPLDRYRYLVSPPIDMIMDNKHFIGLARRGDPEGNGYKDNLTLRRFGRLSSRELKAGETIEKNASIVAQSFGRVEFQGHTEADDPYIILGNQNAKNGLILSIKSKHYEGFLRKAFGLRSKTLQFTFWKIPALDHSEKVGSEEEPPQKEKPITFKVYGEDAKELANDFFVQSPILVDASSTKPIIYFWKHLDSLSGEIEIAKVELDLEELRSSTGSFEVTSKFQRILLPCSKTYRTQCKNKFTNISLNVVDIDSDGILEIVAFNKQAKNKFAILGDAL